MLNIISLKFLTLSALDERSANITCQSFGPDWSVVRIQSKALVCTKDGLSWAENCNDCTTWRLIVWQDGGCESDLLCQQWPTISTVAGRYYGGHLPCSLDNHQYCGVWGSSGIKIHNIHY